MSATTNPLGLTDKQIENIARVCDAMGHGVLIGMGHALKTPEKTDDEMFENTRDKSIAAVVKTLSTDRERMKPETALVVGVLRGPAYAAAASAFECTAWAMADIYTKENAENGTKL